MDQCPINSVIITTIFVLVANVYRFYGQPLTVGNYLGSHLKLNDKPTRQAVACFGWQGTAV